MVMAFIRRWSCCPFFARISGQITCCEVPLSGTQELDNYYSNQFPIVTKTPDQFPLSIDDVINYFVHPEKAANGETVLVVGDE